MTNTRVRKRKYNRKTKKNHKMNNLVNMLKKGHIEIYVVKDREGNTIKYAKEEVYPYVKHAIYSLQNPKDANAILGTFVEYSYRTNMKKKVGGKRNSKVEIYFFPSYLRQLKMQNDEKTQNNKYENFLIVNSSKYDNFGDFLKNKMEDVDNMFAFINQERKSKTAKPTALYKHVVDLTMMNDENPNPPSTSDNAGQGNDGK